MTKPVSALDIARAEKRNAERLAAECRLLREACEALARLVCLDSPITEEKIRAINLAHKAGVKL